MAKHMTGLVTLTLVLVIGTANRPSRAASITVLEDNGNEVNDLSSNNKVAFDVFWRNTLPVWVEVTITPGDTSPSLAYSGIEFNRGTQDWTSFHVELQGDVAWDEVNRIASLDVTIGDVVVTAQSVEIPFVTPLPFPRNLQLGSLSTQVQPDDWFISVDSLQPGDSFRMGLRPAAVPEPSSLLLFGLAASVIGSAAAGRAVRHLRRSLQAGPSPSEFRFES